VISVKQDGQAKVYDVVCAGPHRNFVANGVIVHNCGQSLATQDVIEKGIPSCFWSGFGNPAPKTRPFATKRRIVCLPLFEHRICRADQLSL